MSRPLPSGWDQVPLQALCVGAGEYGANAPKAAYDPALPRFVRITDISDRGTLHREDAVSIDVPDDSGYMLRAGDVLLARSGATVGKSLVFRKQYGRCAFAGYLIRFRPRVDVLSPEFLGYFLQTRAYWEWVRTTQRALAQPNINATEYGRLLVPLPPLAEQREIVTTLKAVEEAIAAGDAVVKQIEQVGRAVTGDLLGTALPGARRSASAPEGWRLARLEDLSDFITKGATPTTMGFGWKESGVRFLRSECIGAGGTFQLRGSQFISHEAHAALARSSIRGGDILVSITGYVGKVCLYPETMPEANINQHIARVRIRAGVGADPSFVHQVLATTAFRRYFESIVTGLAYPQISLRQVRDALVPLPPLPEQRRIAARLSVVRDAASANRGEGAARSAVRSALAEGLITGRVRVSARSAAQMHGT